MSSVFDCECFHPGRWVSIRIAFLFMCPVLEAYKNHFSSRNLLLGCTRQSPGLHGTCTIVLLPLLLLWCNRFHFRSSFSSRLRCTVRSSHFNHLVSISIMNITSLHAQFVSYFNGKDKARPGWSSISCFCTLESGGSWQSC